MKDLYTENCKTLIKEAEEDTINRKIFYVHELEELILIKCPYHPKQSTVNAIPIKIPRAFFTEIGETIQHLCGTIMNLNSQTNLERTN